MSLSGISPVIFFDNEGVVRYVGGASGGTSIPTTVAFVSIFNLMKMVISSVLRIGLVA